MKAHGMRGKSYFLNFPEMIYLKIMKKCEPTFFLRKYSSYFLIVLLIWNFNEKKSKQVLLEGRTEV